jgi:four helix bundle protein
MNTFEPNKPRDIVVRTFDFAVRTIKLCQHLDQKPGVNRTLGQQLLRCGTSIGSNVEEAQAAESRADFVSKYSISLKEAREAHYRLRLLCAARIVTAAKLNSLLTEADEIKRVLGAIIVSTKKRNAK